MKTETNKFTFNEKTHRYFYDGEPMTGVTTVLNVINKPALIGWSARMAVEYIVENFDGELTTELLEDAKKAHAKKRDKAAEQGTDTHALVEQWIKSQIQGTLWARPDDKQLENFVGWAMKHNVRFLESEKRVYDKDLFLAGTADLVCEIDGKTFIGDIKTTSGIYDLTPFMQCAAYAHMLDYDINGTIIINLKKDGSFNEDKDVYYRYDLETDWKAFENALQLYRAMQTWEK